MKSRFVLPAILALVLSSSACINEHHSEEDYSGEVKTITIIAPQDIQFESEGDNAQTKATIINNGSALIFRWAVGDTLGIFPNKGNQVEFPITTQESSTSASFDGGGWALRNNASYAAYYPFSVWNYLRQNETILLDYSGQLQNGNGSYTHLSAYDYLASAKTTPKNSTVTFQMDRLGSILYIDIVVPEPETITSLTISCDEAIFVEKAALNISGSNPVVTPIETKESLTLAFENTTTTEQNETVRAYMAVQPLDFSTKTVTATLETESGSYTAPVTSRVVNKGKAAFLRFSDVFTPVNIEFVDAEVKRICVEHWDTNGDGELSYKEAAAVTDLGDAFKESNVIASFEELQYFTGLTEICDAAFCNCYNLQSIVLPETIQRIGVIAFNACPIARISLPESLKEISHHALYGTNITTIHLPKNVSTISEEGGLYNCSQLTSITVDENNQYFCAEDGVLFNKSKTELVCYPKKKEGTTYTVPAGVITIGCCAFYHTDLVEILLPDSLQEIAAVAFGQADALTTINLPSGLLTIGHYAFYFSRSITSITIPASVTTLQGTICHGGSLQEFIVESGNQNYKAVDGVLFNYSGTELINYPCGNEATSYYVPQGTTVIGGDAFWGSGHLKEISIPEEVTEIGGHAFCDCPNLQSLTILASTPCSFGKDALQGTNIQAIYVPNESVEAYKAAEGWRDYADKIIGIDVSGTVVGPDPEIPD
ncbi:MAG: leucine-rich repeat protein [Bacteroidales bacterium]|nr:leucine-rich repeat protein [Bacteroidales bacterium]